MPEIGILSAAVLGAVAFGSGDMLGACASRRLTAYGAVAISQIAAVAFLFAFVSQSGLSHIGTGATIAAFAGGLAHAVALMLLYQGLAQGRVGVVAPLCAMSSIVVPLLGDLALARPLTEAQLFGILLCGLAALLIAGSGVDGSHRRTLKWSVAIGIASGLSYGAADVVLATIPTDDTNGVVFLARCACVAIAVPVAVFAAARARPDPRPRPRAALLGSMRQPGLAPHRSLALRHIGPTLAIAAGVFDVMGQIGYMMAATRGSMGVASAITALFPAVTVALAVLFFRERISNLQIVGYAVASGGVIVLAA